MKTDLLFRYRKAKEFCVSDFCRDIVTGSLYDCFKDQGELNYEIKAKNLLPYGATIDNVNHFLEVIVNNCLLKYYMACFSLSSPFDDSRVLKKFSGDDGFCIVYDFCSIKEAIGKSILKSKYSNFVPVTYNDKKYDLSPVIKLLVKIVYNHPNASEQEIESLINEAISDGENTKTLGKYVTDALAYKKKNYDYEREMRLIYQRPKGLNNQHPIIIKAIPIKVYISRKMNIIYRHRIIEHSNSLQIPYEFY